jgi:hypothetical protein
MKSTVCGAVVAVFALVGCHTITEELPTQPTKTPPTGVLTIPIPTIPTPTPTSTPKPSPTPGPNPTPTPGPAPTPTPTPPPSAGGCGNPLPPPVTRMKAKIHLKGGSRWTLDSTPLIGPDAAYCKKIGYTDGRLYCPVRPEGAPDREACEAYAIGKARDTGRNGPTWYKDGQLCTGQATTGCENSEENQYQLWVYVSGHYDACTRDDVCGGVDVTR